MLELRPISFREAIKFVKENHRHNKPPVGHKFSIACYSDGHMFGDPWRKRTCLWLRGLPPLTPTNTVEPRGLWVGSSSKRDSAYELKSHRDAKTRSKTFPGIARATAEQW